MIKLISCAGAWHFQAMVYDRGGALSAEDVSGCTDAAL